MEKKEYTYNLSQDTYNLNLPSQGLSGNGESQITSITNYSGSIGYSDSVVNPGLSSIVLNLLNKFRELEDSPQKSLFLELLISIHSSLNRFYMQSYQLSHLPPIHVVAVEDGSILIEWIFNDFRVSFSIEKDLGESSWFLVSNKQLESISKMDLIKSQKMDSIVGELIEFIIKNT